MNKKIKMIELLNMIARGELENKTKINVTNRFLSFWKNNQGLPQLKLVVLEFEKETNENENIESDLPF